MEALGVVDGVDEDADGTSCVFDVLEAASEAAPAASDAAEEGEGVDQTRDNTIW